MSNPRTVQVALAKASLLLAVYSKNTVVKRDHEFPQGVTVIQGKGSNSEGWYNQFVVDYLLNDELVVFDGDLLVPTEPFYAE